MAGRRRTAVRPRRRPFDKDAAGRADPVDAAQRLVANATTCGATSSLATRNVASRDSRKTGCEQVANYRVYCLDGTDRVASAEWIEADDDDAAMAQVKERWSGFKCELWSRDRLVGRIDLRRAAE
jgi:CRISPR/Cas system type I-B associated protein Csh2 (Cas7 group RAMP superfamily)